MFEKMVGHSQRVGMRTCWEIGLAQAGVWQKVCLEEQKCEFDFFANLPLRCPGCFANRCFSDPGISQSRFSNLVICIIYWESIRLSEQVSGTLPPGLWGQPIQNWQQPAQTHRWSAHPSVKSFRSNMSVAQANMYVCGQYNRGIEGRFKTVSMLPAWVWALGP